MLRLSKLTDYGTVVMTHLARSERQVLNANEIATHIFVAVPTVSKILKLLARAGLLISHRGVKGGYGLARPAEQISVAQIIRALEGPISLTECGGTPGQCSQEPFCSISSNWQRISHVIRDALERMTLAEMAQPVAPHAITVSMPASRVHHVLDSGTAAER
jgi:FeS assembly SUF system regulator